MIRALLFWTIATLQLGAQSPPKAATDDVAGAVVSQFNKFDLVALGERHNTRQDQDLRIRVIQHPDFPKKVRAVVVECGNALYQDTLDRFIAGQDVSKRDLEKVWLDTTQSPVGGGDTPVCEQFLDEVRSTNRALPKQQRIRVLAGDPPIDWPKIKSSEDFAPFLKSRDEFAAKLIGREVLDKKEKALVIYGAGHIWRGNVLMPGQNLATLIDQQYPGKLFTVVRLGGTYPDSAKLESLISAPARPVFLPLKGTPAGDLNANAFIGKDIPAKLFPAELGLAGVADACVYSGQESDTIIAPNPPDPARQAERERRRSFMPRPQRR